MEAGATEIDIVINRTLVLEGRWEQLYDEVKMTVFIVNIIIVKS